MFRRERFVGRLARLSFTQTSRWMILAFFGTLVALGMVLGGFAGLFFMLHVDTPWLLTYLTCAGFLMWKAAFHTVLPSPVLARITDIMNLSEITKEGIVHRLCQEVYSKGTLIGFWNMCLNTLMLIWIITFYPSFPISAGVLWGVLIITNEVFCQWRPLTVFVLLCKNVMGLDQTLEEAIFNGFYDEDSTEAEDIEETSESEGV